MGGRKRKAAPAAPPPPPQTKYDPVPGTLQKMRDKKAKRLGTGSKSEGSSKTPNAPASRGGGSNLGSLKDRAATILSDLLGG